MVSEKFSFILASGSPRRKEMIDWLGIPYTVRTASIDETSSIEDPALKSKDIAKKKGATICEILAKESKGPFLVLAADTIVSRKGQCFGKPLHENDARETLGALSGKSHQVFTGVYLGLYDKEGLKEETFHCETEVEFHQITSELMDLYIKSGEHKDKAGSYGIQGQALTFIKSIKGSYSNVVGLPLAEVILKIKGLLPGSFEDCFQ
jgi:septum formation protein